MNFHRRWIQFCRHCSARRRCQNIGRRGPFRNPVRRRSKNNRRNFQFSADPLMEMVEKAIQAHTSTAA